MASVTLYFKDSSYSPWINGGEDYSTMSSDRHTYGQFNGANLNLSVYKITAIGIYGDYKRNTSLTYPMGNTKRGATLYDGSSIGSPGTAISSQWDSSDKMSGSYSGYTNYYTADTNIINRLLNQINNGLVITVDFHADNTGSTSGYRIYGKNIRLVVTYEEKPKYTVTWKNYDGTVLETDTGVYEGTSPSYNSSTPTRPTTKEYVYTFSGWDRTLSAVTSNVTYTAQFTAADRLYEVIVECKPNSNSGQSCQATGAGKYKFGAVVTIESINIPLGHKFSNGEIYGKEGYFYYTNPFSFTIDDNITSDGTYGTITVRCYIEQSAPGTITTVVSPADAGIITGGGTYDYGLNITLTALAGDIYEFISWNDGVTDTTRTITVLGDTTYTAYFKLNAVFVDTSRLLGVYVDITEAAEIYADETKVYG